MNPNVGISNVSIPVEVGTSQVVIQADLSEAQIFSTEIGASYVLNKNADYEGDYTVTPRLYDQTLETADKVMSDDVTVYEIPVVYTSNLYGGQTVVIG